MKMMRGTDDEEGPESPERYLQPREMMEEQSSGADDYSD